jgi:hypothetical protein
MLILCKQVATLLAYGHQKPIKAEKSEKKNNAGQDVGTDVLTGRQGNYLGAIYMGPHYSESKEGSMECHKSTNA